MIEYASRADQPSVQLMKYERFVISVGYAFTKNKPSACHWLVFTFAMVFYAGLACAWAPRQPASPRLLGFLFVAKMNKTLARLFGFTILPPL